MSESEEGLRAGSGWNSDLPTFGASPAANITSSLAALVRDASSEQLNAWRKDVPWLQKEFRSYLSSRPEENDNWTVLEYELPREFRRSHVILRGQMKHCALASGSKSLGCRHG